ncbi:MAG: hypothetical protein GX811_05715 [Lentisphaerae bacterium]|nr:hypothetical protein [Lentisphaerota bacterium]
MKNRSLKMALSIFCVLSCIADTYAEEASETNKVADNPLQQTVITSTRLTYDKEKGFALFDENVVVEDPQLKMKCASLKIEFDADDNVVLLEAEGDVVMAQDDKIAIGDRARYDVIEGKVSLAGNPKVRRGGHEISGDTIVFWRNDNRMLVEPNARVKIMTGDEKHGGLSFFAKPQE